MDDTGNAFGREPGERRYGIDSGTEKVDRGNSLFDKQARNLTAKLVLDNGMECGDLLARTQQGFQIVFHLPRVLNARQSFDSHGPFIKLTCRRERHRSSGFTQSIGYHKHGHGLVHGVRLSVAERCQMPP